MSKVTIVIFVIIIIGAGYWFYQSASSTEEPTLEEQACINSGGTVSTSLCCKLTSDFPNLCLVGPCGCSPDNSHEIKICDCGPDKCFNGNECVTVKGNETADWNTYRNEEYGFEIKYPKEWYQDKKESDLRKSYSDKKGFDIIRFSPNEEFLDWSDKEGLIKIDIISDFNEDLQIWFNKISTPCTECAPFPPSFDSYTTIDSKPAIKAIQGVPGTAGWISVFCTKDNIRYDFTLVLPDTEDKFLINDHKNIFNQILSTFRFLE